MKKRFEFTPDPMTEVEEGEVFTYGSNLLGINGAGSAGFARYKLGVQEGVGFGRNGKNSFAFPTLKTPGGERLTWEQIHLFMEMYLKYVASHQNEVFYLTKIGTGLAGITISEISGHFCTFYRNTKHQNLVYPIEFHQKVMMHVDIEPNFSKIIKSTPLYKRLFLNFIMDDIGNWIDGVYLGDKTIAEKQVNKIIKEVERWVLDDAPGGFELLKLKGHEE